MSGTVVVESDEKLQEVIGFGGAFTDAATINFFKLPEDVQEKVTGCLRCCCFVVAACGGVVLYRAHENANCNI